MYGSVVTDLHTGHSPTEVNTPLILGCQGNDPDDLPGLLPSCPTWL